MTREEKDIEIGSLTELFSKYNNFYLTDVDTLDSEKTSQLRRMCFTNGVKMQVAKNTLIKKALEKTGNDYSELFGTLKGSTAIMFTEVANAPAKLIKDLRKKADKPVIKSAYIASEIYIGDQVDNLANIRSKEELIGEIIGLLQSPARNIISGLLEKAKKQGGEVAAE